MKTKGFDTYCKKNAGDEFIFFCSLNIWSIFATRKRNDTATAVTKSFGNVRTGLKMVP